MADPEWGTKRICRNCGCRYYDLMREPVVCPRCQAVHELDNGAKARRQPRPSEKRLEPQAAGETAAQDGKPDEIDSQKSIDDGEGKGSS